MPTKAKRMKPTTKQLTPPDLTRFLNDDASASLAEQMSELSRGRTFVTAKEANSRATQSPVDRRLIEVVEYKISKTTAGRKAETLTLYAVSLTKVG